jgi:signal transduction histidine kinase
LGVFIIFNAHKDIQRWLMAIFTFAVGIWGLGGIFISLEQNPEYSLFLWRLAHIGVIMIPVALLHFTILFLKKDKYKFLITLSYILAFIWQVTNFLGIFITKVRYVFGQFYYDSPPTYLYIIFAAYFVFAVLLVHYWLVKDFLKATGLRKKQIQYVLLGTGLGFAGGTPSFIPVFGIDFYPILNFSTALFPIFTAFGVLRYRLMDIRLVIKRSSIFTLLVLTLTAIYSFLIILVSNSIGNIFGQWSQIVTSLIVSTLIVAGFQPLKLLIQKATRNFLFKDEYDIQEVLAELANDLSSSLELKHLFDDVGGIIDRVFHPTKSGILLLDKKSEYYVIGDADGFSAEETKNLGFSLLDPLVRYFKNSKELVVLEELKRKLESGYLASTPELKELSARLDRTGGEVFLPLFSKDSLIGIFILGKKKSGDIYTSEDIKLLEIGGAQSAVAIENAQMYSEVKNFNFTLQAEVDKATKELRLANVRLKKLDEAKSEFISIASHQLRTPLTVVKGYVSMMLEGSFGALTDPEVESLHKVYDSNQRLINLVEDLLNISRIESGRIQYEWEGGSFDELVRSVVEDMTNPAKKKKLYLELEPPAGRLPEVKMDKDKLRQVLSNLIDNGLKYTERGGIRLYLTKQGKNVVLKVADTGMGIEPTDMPNLFQKFSRGQGMSRVHTEGTGLGLYVAKEIIKAHGGKVWAESAGKNKGSQFYISLPGLAVGEKVLAEEEVKVGGGTAPAAEAKAEIVKAPAKRKKIIKN